MIKRLKAIPEANRLRMHKQACGGDSGYAVAGWDRMNMKASNAVFAWIDAHTYRDRYDFPPTDDVLANFLEA